MLANQGHRETLAATADVNRKWILHGCWIAMRTVELKETPVVGDGLAREEESQDVERLVQAGASLAVRGVAESERVQLVGQRAPADAEIDASIADVVEGRGHLGQQGRMTERVAQNHVTDTDP